jgi:hypothetical protein
VYVQPNILNSCCNLNFHTHTHKTKQQINKDLNVRQALMLQSKQLLAATLAVDEPDPTLSSVTALPEEKGATAGSSTANAAGDGGEGGEGAELEDMERRTSTLGRRKKGSSSKQKAAVSMDDSQLKRGTSKRRSLGL